MPNLKPTAKTCAYLDTLLFEILKHGGYVKWINFRDIKKPCLPKSALYRLKQILSEKDFVETETDFKNKHPKNLRIRLTPDGLKAARKLLKAKLRDEA